MSKVCLLVCTYCPSPKSAREELIWRCLNSVKKLKSTYGSDICVVIWDNNSISPFQEKLKSLSWMDRLILCNENLYDYGAVHGLSILAEDMKIPYVIYCNDDIEFLRFDFLEECKEVLEEHPHAGYARLNLFDFYRLQIFDKQSVDPYRDESNSQRIYNWTSKEQVDYRRIHYGGLYEYFLTNMHWHLFPGLCKTSIFKELCPFKDHSPLQSLEGYMIKNYHLLNLKTIVLNKGVCHHMGVQKLSMRLKQTRHPVIRWDHCKTIIDSYRGL